MDAERARCCAAFAAAWPSMAAAVAYAAVPMSHDPGRSMAGICGEVVIVLVGSRGGWDEVEVNRGHDDSTTTDRELEQLVVGLLAGRPRVPAGSWLGAVYA